MPLNTANKFPKCWVAQGNGERRIGLRRRMMGEFVYIYIAHCVRLPVFPLTVHGKDKIVERT